MNNLKPLPKVMWGGSAGFIAATLITIVTEYNLFEIKAGLAAAITWLVFAGVAWAKKRGISIPIPETEEVDGDETDNAPSGRPRR